jgi:hypothetical protein
MNKAALAFTLAQLTVPALVLGYMVAVPVLLPKEYAHLRTGASVYIGMSVIGAAFLILRHIRSGSVHLNR